MSTEPSDKLLSLRDQSLAVQINNFVVDIAEVTKQSEALVPAANDFKIATEAEFQFADEMRVALEAEAKSLDERGMGLTRPLDDFKSYIMGEVKPAIDNNKAAAAIYNRKALDFRRQEREKAEAARREAERIQRETQARLAEEARKKDLAAAKLKEGGAAQRRAQEEAEALRQAAVHTPVTMAVSAPAPVATASNVVEKWEAEITKPSDFLRWLADHPEWQNIVTFGKGPMNRLASQYKDTLTVPGVSITSSEGFRKKSTR